MLADITQKFKALLFTRANQQAFLEDVSMLVEDGVPASQAISTIAQIATSPTSEVAENILQKIGEGKQIADGMDGWFPHTIVEIVRAGEEGGTLAENISAAARSLARTAQGYTALLSATIYPCTVLIMGLGVSVFIKHSVFNNFLSIKPLALWPDNGRELYEFATFIENWWWLLIASLIATGFLIFRLLRDLTGELRQTLDQIPVLSLYRDTQAARFMETTGLLLTNGIILKKTLTILQRKASPYLAWHLYMMEFRLSGGRENIADVIDTGLIPKQDILRLKVIAKGRGFEHALLRMGRLSSDRTVKQMQVIARITGGLLLGLGAAWAAFMVLGIYNVGSFVGS